MEKVRILIIGTNSAIMQTIARLVNENEQWQAVIANSYAEACDLCLKQHFAVALIGAGLSETEEHDFEHFIASKKPDLPIVKHYGGG
ncbi:MAG: hypothetical protein EOO47_01140, partial [Flavobacterium sp.]